MKVKKIQFLTIVDDLFTRDELEIMDRYFASYTYWGLGYDMNEYGASSATLCRSLKWDQWVGLHHILDDIRNIMSRRLDTIGIKTPLFSRCLINNFKFGDSPMFHKDTPGNPEGQTFMVYPNKVWNLNWGGYTAFADKEDDVVACANPKPGRIVIFPGEINHSGVAPTKVHEGYGRFSIAYQDPLGYPKQEELQHVKPQDIEKTSFTKVFGDNHYRLL